MKSHGIYIMLKEDSPDTDRKVLKIFNLATAWMKAAILGWKVAI